MDRAVLERPQPLRKTLETEFVADGREIVNVRLRLPTETTGKPSL
jgi:hypothetical protein